jgi:DNA-binding NarL/FixJ family response regulator
MFTWETDTRSAVSRLMQRRRVDSPLSQLTARENQILALMAEGRSNSGIASQLSLSERRVEAASAQLFRKLGLEQSPSLNRRVRRTHPVASLRVVLAADDWGRAVILVRVVTRS